MISQSQLILPLLDAIEERGGAARERDVYDLIAKKVDLPAENRVALITTSGHSYNALEWEVRWAQQHAKLQGLLRPANSGLWTLTDKGSIVIKLERSCIPGILCEAEARHSLIHGRAAGRHSDHSEQMAPADPTRSRLVFDAFPSCECVL